MVREYVFILAVANLPSEIVFEEGAIGPFYFFSFSLLQRAQRPRNIIINISFMSIMRSLSPEEIDLNIVRNDE